MVEAKLTQITKTADLAAKTKGFKDLIDKAGVPDLMKIIDFCVGDSITKNDAKIALDHMASARLKSLKNDECKSLCEAASAKIQPKIGLFATEVNSFTFH